MSTQQPDSATAHSSQQPAPASPPAPRGRWLSRLLWLGGLLGLTALAIPVLYSWWSSRLTHSLTEDAFVEAYIVNIAPQTGSGPLVGFSVQENDRAEQGQVLAEIDPVPYRAQVNIARSKVSTARAELRQQEGALARLRLEVPIQIDIARRGLAAAEADQAR